MTDDPLSPRLRMLITIALAVAIWAVVVLAVQRAWEVLS